MKLYTVYAKYVEKEPPRYYVINKQTKQIQSTWKSWSQAISTALDLNKHGFTQRNGTK